MQKRCHGYRGQEGCAQAADDLIEIEAGDWRGKTRGIQGSAPAGDMGRQRTCHPLVKGRACSGPAPCHTILRTSPRNAGRHGAPHEQTHPVGHHQIPDRHHSLLCRVNHARLGMRYSANTARRRRFWNNTVSLATSCQVEPRALAILRVYRQPHGTGKEATRLSLGRRRLPELLNDFPDI